MLQGRLDAAQATNVTLQEQLAAMREATTQKVRPARAKSAAARPTRTPGAARKVAAVAPPSSKVARRKRGQA